MIKQQRIAARFVCLFLALSSGICGSISSEKVTPPLQYMNKLLRAEMTAKIQVLNNWSGNETEIEYSHRILPDDEKKHKCDILI